MADNSKKQRGKPFQSGQSGNPGGRPKLPEDVKHVREMARQYTEEAIAALAGVLRSDCSPGAKVSAAQALLDRGWGKAESTVTMTVKRNAREMTDDELAAIAAGSGGNVADAPEVAEQSSQLH